MEAVRTMQHYTFEWANLLAEIAHLKEIFKQDLNGEQVSYISQYIAIKHDNIAALADHIEIYGEDFADAVYDASINAKLKASTEFVAHVEHCLSTMK